MFILKPLKQPCRFHWLKGLKFFWCCFIYIFRSFTKQYLCSFHDILFKVYHKMVFIYLPDAEYEIQRNVLQTLFKHWLMDKATVPMQFFILKENKIQRESFQIFYLKIFFFHHIKMSDISVAGCQRRYISNIISIRCNIRLNHGLVWSACCG